ncbi:MAG TPA: hypothetical protein VFR23_20215 [Jiangellaceae bacterium]|nr:hypothetical protein [Jiangellaceae bacterium]
MSMGATVFYESANELATLTNTFSVSGTPTDPTTVSLTVTTPAGVATTYTYALAEITKSGTGVYTKDIACTADGTWQYVWTGTGAASDVTAGTWTVFNTELQKLYCSIEELKSRFGLASTDTVDDFEMKLAIESASREIDDHCDRHFWRGTSTRTFVPDSAYCCSMPSHNDIVSITTLKTDTDGDGVFETTWATTDYQLLPYNALTQHAEPRPYTSIKAIGSYTFPTSYSTLARDDRVEIVGVFGWPQIPSNVKQACLIIAAETLKLKDAPFGVAGFGEFGAVRVRDNPKAAKLLRPYEKYPVLVA